MVSLNVDSDMPDADIPLYLFAKAPVAGKVKRRLAPPLDAQQSALVARALLEHAAQGVEAHWPGSRVLNVAPDLAHPAFSAFVENPAWQTRIQTPADLGERMREAVQEGIGRHGASVVVGTDIPGLDGKILELAYSSLRSGHQVVGPSQDGGFYLLGLHSMPADLFDGIEWGRAGVYAALLARAENRGIEIKPLPTLTDCDYFEDLRWAAMYVPGFRESLERTGFDLSMFDQLA